jgi:hypothetical protein
MRACPQCGTSNADDAISGSRCRVTPGGNRQRKGPSKQRTMILSLAAAVTTAFALSACGGSSSPQAAHSPATSTAHARDTASSQPTVTVTVTCSPDSTVNACDYASQTSVPGGTAISILDPAEPETGSDTSSETFTLTIQPGNNFRILGLKVASNANGGSVSVSSGSSAEGFATKNPTTGSITISDVIDFVGLNISGGIDYKTGNSTG